MVLVALSLVASACGSRLAQDEIVAANTGRASGADAGASSAVDENGDLIDGDPSATTEGEAGGASSSDSGVAVSGGTAVEPGAGAANEPAAGDVPAGAKSTIRIASVSTLSGPAGAAQAPGVKALQVWAKWVNAKGGVNGHPIEVLIADDAGDPARHSAAVRDMVENKKVIAFVNQWASQTHQGAAGYLAQKRVPVIGGEATNSVFWSNPMYFPQSLHFTDLFNATLATAARFIDGRRFGSLVCRESQICEDASRGYKAGAQAAGFEVVYEGKGSLAQPDFTGECLAARGAEVELLAVIFDANSVKRVARSCAAQGFKPTYVIGNGISDGGTARMPEFEGAVGATGSFPFVVNSTPGTKEFHDAYRRFAPNEELAQASSLGWTAAKLFERAAAKLGDQPTSEQLLEALWSIKGDDLGGLTSPLTFVKDQPAPRAACYYALRISGGKYVAPDGATRTCR